MRTRLTGRISAFIAVLIGALMSALVLAALPLASPAGGARENPRPGAAGIGDRYFPPDGNGGYQVLDYDLRVRYRPATDRLLGLATIRARSLHALSRFNLDLVGLRVDGVRVDGAPAGWARRGHELRITPHRAIARSERFVVRIRYHGVPRLLDENVGLGGWFTTEDGAIAIGQPHVAATWFPVNDHPVDKATYSIAVTVPRGVEAIANGRLVGTHRRGPWTTWSWRMGRPMASYLATATTGQFDVRSYRRDGIAYWDAIDPVLYQAPEPRTGTRFAVSGGDDSAYKRLTRTITVPAAGGELRFAVTRDTEMMWDFFMVEARTAGGTDWTTLPDENGHTTRDTGFACPFWLDLHPFLRRYETASGPGTCSPTGTSGEWHSASGASEGYETWAVDLAEYAGSEVEVSLAVVSDESVALPGAFVDDVVGPGGQGSTSFEDDGNPLDGWAVTGPPPGSPGNSGNWRLAGAGDIPTLGDAIEATLDTQPRIIRFLEGYLGSYPFGQAGGLVDNDPGLGFALENQTRPIYSTVFFAAGAPVEEMDGVVVHELAHQWVGDSVALHRWRDIWLNEGFATYTEWLWAEDQDRATTDEIFAFLATIPASDEFWKLRIGDPGPDRLFDGAVYDRGAMTLHALRNRIGDDDFFRVLRRWTTLHEHGNATTPQFIALSERVSGRQLDRLFRQWLYTAAKPPGLDAVAARVDAGEAAAMLRKEQARHVRH